MRSASLVLLGAVPNGCLVLFSTARLLGRPMITYQTTNIARQCLAPGSKLQASLTAYSHFSSIEGQLKMSLQGWHNPYQKPPVALCCFAS